MTNDDQPLSEEAVRRLLTRASELEAGTAARLSIAELREIAREAGIAPAAFEQALAELEHRSLQEAAPPSSPPPSRLSRLRTAVLGAVAVLAVLFAIFVFMRLFP